MNFAALASCTCILHLIARSTFLCHFSFISFSLLSFPLPSLIRSLLSFLQESPFLFLVLFKDFWQIQAAVTDFGLLYVLVYWEIAWCVPLYGSSMLLKVDREIQTQAEDLAKTKNDQRKEWFTARSFANACLDDILILKSTLECFSYTFTHKIYEKMA